MSGKNCNLKGEYSRWGCGCQCAHKARLRVDRCTDDLPQFKFRPKHFDWKWVCMAPRAMGEQFVYLQTSEHCVCELFEKRTEVPPLAGER